LPPRHAYLRGGTRLGDGAVKPDVVCTLVSDQCLKLDGTFMAASDGDLGAGQRLVRYGDRTDVQPEGHAFSVDRPADHDPGQLAP
jgi:hypothetical protein